MNGKRILIVRKRSKKFVKLWSSLFSVVWCILTWLVVCTSAWVSLQPRMAERGHQDTLHRIKYIYTYTDKKKKNFLIYKEIQYGAVAKSYMNNGLLIRGNICAFPHVLGSPISYMTLQLLHSEFPYIWGKFYFIFYKCRVPQFQSPRQNWDPPSPFPLASVSAPEPKGGHCLASGWGGGGVPIRTTSEKKLSTLSTLCPASKEDECESNKQCRLCFWAVFAVVLFCPPPITQSLP